MKFKELLALDTIYAADMVLLRGGECVQVVNPQTGDIIRALTGEFSGKEDIGGPNAEAVDQSPALELSHGKCGT